jgi:hypothetical protein
MILKKPFPKPVFGIIAFYLRVDAEKLLKAISPV